MEHFGAVIRGAAAPLVSARDGLQNLRVTEAIVAAARSRRVVEVPIALSARNRVARRGRQGRTVQTLTSATARRASGVVVPKPKNSR